MKKGKVIIGIAAAIIVVAVALFFLVRSGLLSGKGDSSDKVYVQSVASVVSMYTGAQNQYMGVVESQDTEEIKTSTDRTVKEVLVEEGDEVKSGDVLFTYDTDELKNQLAQAKLDLEGYDNEISAYNNQITELTAQRDAAYESEKLDYTTQIQQVQMSIQQVQNSKKSKNIEIEKINKSIEESEVKCTLSGVVKSVGDPENISYDYDGSASAFITIVATGDYRIKGTVNEQNVWSISEGQEVIIRSRVDDSTWSGKITKIDTENPESNSNEYYYSDSSSESSSKYPFYVTLDSTEGLMLSQHVYIEMDYGQGEAKQGIWLDMGYIVFDGDNTYVWAEDNRGKLEKRKVSLGQYDDYTGTYEIVDGLEMTDYIAYAMSYLYEGVDCTTNDAEIDYESPMYTENVDDMGTMDTSDMYEYMSDEERAIYEAYDAGELTEDEFNEAINEYYFNQLSPEEQELQLKYENGELTDEEYSDALNALYETMYGDMDEGIMGDGLEEGEVGIISEDLESGVEVME